MKVSIYFLLLISLLGGLNVIAQTNQTPSDKIPSNSFSGTDSLSRNEQAGLVKNKDLYLRQLSDTTLVIPNVFTPNNDNQNDEFVISSSGKYFISFKVFTRTGILIYKTKAKTIKWDGRLESGEKVLPGLYYYIVEMTDSTPQVKKTGFVYIFDNL